MNKEAAYAPIRIVDSAIIDLPSYNRFISNNDKNLLYIFCDKKGKIYTYDLHMRSFTDSSFYPALVDHKMDFWMNDSTLYYINYAKNEIIRIKKKDQKASVFTDTTKEKQLLILYLSMYVDTSNKLFLYAVPDLSIADSLQRQQYFNSGLLVSCSLSGSSIVHNNEFAYFPKQYQRHFYNEYYPVAAVMGNGKVAYVFSKTTAINIYNSESKKISTLKTDLEPNELDPANLDSIYYYDYLRNYELQNEKFCKMVYDNKNKRFYVFRTRKISKNSRYEIPLWKDKAFVIYAVDSTGKVAGIRAFECIGDYVLYASFCSEGKLYLVRENGNGINLEAYEL